MLEKGLLLSLTVFYRRTILEKAIASIFNCVLSADIVGKRTVLRLHREISVLADDIGK